MIMYDSNFDLGILIRSGCNWIRVQKQKVDTKLSVIRHQVPSGLYPCETTFVENQRSLSINSKRQE